MPTPRQHGGAELIPIPLASPGFRGLNTELNAAVLTPDWATEAMNALMDSAGRLAVRRGWKIQTLDIDPVGGFLNKLHEYRSSSGESVMITSDSGGSIWTGVEEMTYLLSNEGSPDWIDHTLLNFNNRLIAISATLGAYTGDDSVLDELLAVSGTLPDGDVATSAFGRVWWTDSTGIKYSALLDETRWDEEDGAGYIEMLHVWPNGVDQVVAIAQLNASLVVFGTRQIVFFQDGSGSTLGLDPLNMYVADTIEGVGIVNRRAFVPVDGDLWFMSRQGLQSLGRLVAERSNPLNNISTNVQSAILADLNDLQNADTLQLIRLRYLPSLKVVLLLFPKFSNDVSTTNTWVFDTRLRMEDGTYRVTQWNAPIVDVWETATGTKYALLWDEAGISTYGTFLDNGTSYNFRYRSGWLSVAEPYIKILKRFAVLARMESNTAVDYFWAFDFSTQPFEASVALPGAPVTEWGIGEWTGFRDPENVLAPGDVAQWSGGNLLITTQVPTQGTGQYIQVGLELPSISASYALQQINLFMKLGRMV
jgi:hypothetical protein